jgi:hypothetical protein
MPSYNRHHPYRRTWVLKVRAGARQGNHSQILLVIGLGYDADDIERIIAERKDAQARAKAALPLAESRRPTKEEQSNKCDVVTLKSERGNSADYIASRLKRDRPDILDRVASGDSKRFESINPRD